MGYAFHDAPSTGFSDQPEGAGTYHKALEVTYIDRRQDLLRFLHHYGASHADAEEITQDVFVRAMAPTRGIPDNLFAWLLTCAKNLAIKRHQRSQRESTMSDVRWRIWETRSADERVDVHGELERRERVAAIRRIVATLDRMEARCLILKSQGLTFREIGEQLDIPLRRASYLVSTALEKVEQSVQE